MLTVMLPSHAHCRHRHSNLAHGSSISSESSSCSSKRCTDLLQISSTKYWLFSEVQQTFKSMTAGAKFNANELLLGRFECFSSARIEINCGWNNVPLGLSHWEVSASFCQVQLQSNTWFNFNTHCTPLGCYKDKRDRALQVATGATTEGVYNSKKNKINLVPAENEVKLAQPQDTTRSTALKDRASGKGTHLVQTG
jgi:hypothetical protein